MSLFLFFMFIRSVHNIFLSNFLLILFIFVYLPKKSINNNFKINVRDEEKDVISYGNILIIPLGIFPITRYLYGGL